MENIIKVIKISKPLHSLVVLLSFLIITGSVIQLIAPVLSKFIVDDIVARVQQKGGSQERLILLIIISFVMNFLGVTLTSITNRIGDHFAGKLRKFLTEEFYNKVLTLPQSYFDSQLSGKIVNQLSRGIFTIIDFMNTSSNFILPTFLQSIFTIIILAYYDLPIAFFTFILFPIYLILSYYSTKKWGKEEVRKNEIEDYSRGRIQEVISNISLVKSFNQQKNEYKIISNSLTDINNIYGKQSKIFHLFDFARNLSLVVIFFIINIIVFYSTFIGRLTIGEMVLILQLVTQARFPLFAMSFILTQIEQTEKGSKEFFEVLDLPSAENYTSSFDTKKVTDPTIRFDSVSFNYEKSEKILRDVSFTIEKNEKVALVGHSGAGKSTIVNLMLKFYNPTGGHIFLKDQNYNTLGHQFIRNNISLVFQENELFSSSIKENVSYGVPHATEKDIINSLKMANAYEFVMKLSKGIDSEVGERGVRLSGGQKQRIQIARALLKDAPILILDEATSSLDAKSEKEVQDALEKLMKDKLVIIIAHRFSTIQNVNKIIVVNSGSIVATGSPQELAKKKGIYSELLHYQIEGNKKLLEKFDIY